MVSLDACLSTTVVVKGGLELMSCFSALHSSQVDETVERLGAVGRETTTGNGHSFRAEKMGSGSAMVSCGTNCSVCCRSFGSWTNLVALSVDTWSREAVSEVNK